MCFVTLIIDMSRGRGWKMEVWQKSCSRAPCAPPGSAPSLRRGLAAGSGTGQPCKLGSGCWEHRELRDALFGVSLLCLGATFKLRPSALVLAWARLEVYLCLALILTCWLGLRPASSLGTLLGCDWPWLLSPDMPCSPCSGMAGLSPCWGWWCPATLLSPWLLARLPWGEAHSLLLTNNLWKTYFFFISAFYAFLPVLFVVFFCWTVLMHLDFILD